MADPISPYGLGLNINFEVQIFAPVLVSIPAAASLSSPNLPIFPHIVIYYQFCRLPFHKNSSSVT